MLQQQQHQLYCKTNRLQERKVEWKGKRKYFTQPVKLQLIEAGGEVEKKEKLDVITILCKEHNFKFKICDDTLSGVIIR